MVSAQKKLNSTGRRSGRWRTSERCRCRAAQELDSLKLLYAASSGDGHTMPGHPECFARSNAALNGLNTALEEANQATVNDASTPRDLEQLKNALANGVDYDEATDELLQLVHVPAYVEGLRELLPRAREAGCMTIETGGPTYFTPYSVMAAVSAVGAACAVADEIVAFNNAAVSTPAGLVLTRPPGHHAVPGGPKGFCLYNGAAVVARHVQQKHNCDKVVVIDFDVHYGNGTADAFRDDSSVLYASMHQERIFPFEGNIDEVGQGEGEGCNLALPLPAGTGRTLAFESWDTVIAPKAREFLRDAKKGFVVISAGFDAHFLDPTAQFMWDASDYYHLARRARELAGECAGGRLLYIMEGGYHVDNGNEASRGVGGALGVSIAELTRSTLGLASVEETLAARGNQVEASAPEKKAGLFGNMFGGGGGGAKVDPVEASRFALYGRAPRPDEPMELGMDILHRARQIHGI
ncbi:histone deacetylase [Pseudoscourfieldia marina]